MIQDEEVIDENGSPDEADTRDVEEVVETTNE